MSLLLVADFEADAPSTAMADTMARPIISAAANGELALDLVGRHRPDAILLDLHMPVMDGITATRELTAKHPAVAVVVLTTYADDRSVLDALNADARRALPRNCPLSG